MKALSVSAAFVAGALAVACGGALSLDDRRCPCATGYVCCDNVCVAEKAPMSGFGGAPAGKCAFSPDGPGDSFGDGGNGVPLSDGGARDTGPVVDPAQCALYCEVAAANGCNVNGFTADSECVALCAESPTQSQIDCLQKSPCSELVSALAGHAPLCGLFVVRDGGTSDAATPDSGTSDGGSCSDLCTSNSFCQSVCGPLPGSEYCCDLPTGACYPTSGPSCPK